MTTLETIKVTFLLLSDTHGAMPLAPSTPVAYRQPLPKADVVIHSGDLTCTGKPDEHKKAVELLKSIRAELKIVIPGNHDLTLDSEYCRTHPRLYGWDHDHTSKELQEIREMYTGQEALDAGIVYLEEGSTALQLKNGARFAVYASAYTPEFCDWGFGYPRITDRYTSLSAENPVPWFIRDKPAGNIDIMITHGPPLNMLDETTSEENVGCHYLAEAVNECKPLLHVFGHIHEAHGAIEQSWIEVPNQHTQSKVYIHVDQEESVREMGIYLDGTHLVQGKQTLFVNASIMNVKYKPIQSPWIVDLMLPREKLWE